MRVLLFLILSLTCTAPHAWAQKIDTAKLDSDLTRLMDEPGMVGLAIVVIEDGQIVWQKGYGETLESSGDRVTTDTVFRWASLSKGVASAVVGKQTEKGLFDFDTPIGKLSPSLRLPGGGEQRAAVRDILSHRVGITRNAYDNRLEGGVSPVTIRQSLADLPAECPVGTCYTYQNVAFDSVSEAVAYTSRQSYFEAAQMDVLLPLGMTRVTMTKDGLQTSPRWARPHNRKGVNVYRRMRESYFRVPAAGGVNGSIEDMGHWMRAQMGLRPDVLTQDMLNEMHTAYVPTNDELRRVRRYYPRLTSAHYGMGWRIYNYAGHKVVGHRGAVNGYRAAIMFDPERDTGVAVLWNSSSNQPVGLQFIVMDMAYELNAQDWLYFDQGPDLRGLRARHTRLAQDIGPPPRPRLNPARDGSGLPADHGQPFFMVTSCFMAEPYPERL